MASITDSDALSAIRLTLPAAGISVPERRVRQQQREAAAAVAID